MSGSLAGGLLPLGNRAGSRSEGPNKSTLTGGLIPLTSASARPTASFRSDEPPEGSGSGRWGEQEEHQQESAGRGKEGVLDGSRSEKKSKKSASSRRRGGKEKSGGRRGSRGSRDIPDDNNPIIAGLGGGRGGNKEGWERSGGSSNFGLSPSAAGDVNVDEDEDDSYLFMGATAGAKGKKSAGGGAAEEPPDYDSTDSFGLPKVKPKPKARKQVDLDPRSAHSESETKTNNALGAESSVSARTGPSMTSGDGGKRDGIGISSSRGAPTPAASDDWLSHDTTAAASSSYGRGRPSPTPVAAAAAAAAAAARKPAVAAPPEPEIDLGDDFDFPDDNINELLEMTDPAVLAKSRASASVPASASASAPPSAAATMPPLLPLGGSTDSPRGDQKKPRERAPDVPPLSSSAAAGATDNDDGHTVALGELDAETARRRSPSPPSSPREDRRSTRPSLRSRPGRGLTYSGSGDSLKGSGGGGGEVSDEKIGEGGQRDRRGAAARDGASVEPSPRAQPRVPDLEASAASGVTGMATHAKVAASRLESKGEEHGGEGREDAKRLLTSSGPGIGPKVGDGRAPRRSALAGADKSKKSQSRQPKSRGVTFDDDLAGVDALDILPGSSSDEGESRSGGGGGGAEIPAYDDLPSDKHDYRHDSAKPAPIPTATSPGVAGVVAAKPSSDPVVGGSGGGDYGGGAGGESSIALQPRAAAAPSSGGLNRRPSAAMTEGLSPAAARLMAEDSSSEESSHVPQKASEEASAMEALLGLREPRPGSSSAEGRPQEGTTGPGSSLFFGQGGPKDGGGGEEDMTTTNEAKLDLALGFTPSSLDGGRNPRRTLPAGRRRRSRGGALPTATDPESRQAGFASLASIPADPVSLPERSTPGTSTVTSSVRDTTRRGAGAGAGAGGTVAATTGVAGAGSDPASHVSGMPSTSTAPVATASHVSAESSADIAVSATGNSTEPSKSISAGVSSSAPQSPTSNSSTPGASKSNPGGAIPGPFSTGPPRGSSGGNANTSAIAESSRAENTVESRGVDASVLASLERQLVLLAKENEAIVARSTRDEQRMQKDSDLARDATAAAQARAFESEAALAVARARISQLEAEAAEHASHLAAVESRAASGLRAEQEACLKRISDAETRHQEGIHQAESRHGKALAELKRLHKGELEDTRRRNSDSKTLEALAGQVQASAGAVKLLQSEMMERKNVSDVSREGQMEARERLIQDLEQSARRAQQTAEDEVQRLQGTLMAMDQVMSALRGQNAGERERLRQEHLRMEALQGSMVAEVSAVRKSVDEERQRLSERCAALDREKRQAEAELRVESDRLAEQRVELKTERQSFAALQVSASKAAEEMARRSAGEAERLNLARQSLEREASALEARLNSARADLQKADHVRGSLDRLREQDELERRRLKALSAELERAFEEVRTRSEDSEERRREAEADKAEALAASKAASKEREAAQLQSVRVEEVARRLEAERTSIAQARAQSATELSTSRRLKAELARAFAAQQRQQAADMVLSSRALPLDRPHASGGGGGGGGGDTGAGLAIGVDGRGGRGGASVGAMMMMPGLPPEATFGQAAAGSGLGSTSLPPPPASDNVAGGVGAGNIPFTGVGAAEATLQAISSAPPFPGLDVGRELGRLARRAADLRECTKAQSAFLSSSRAVRFASAAHLAPKEAGTTMAGAGPETPESSPPGLFADSVSEAGRGGGGVEVGVGQQTGVRGGAGGFGHGALGVGLSSTVMEELDKIERACSQRCSALKEEEPFVDTLGRGESPVAV